MTDLLVASFAIWRVISAVPRDDHIVHIEGTPPLIWQMMPYKREGKNGESRLGFPGANLLSPRRRLVTFRPRIEHCRGIPPPIPPPSQSSAALLQGAQMVPVHIYGIYIGGVCGPRCHGTRFQHSLRGVSALRSGTAAAADLIPRGLRPGVYIYGWPSWA